MFNPVKFFVDIMAVGQDLLSRLSVEEMCHLKVMGVKLAWADYLSA